MVNIDYFVCLLSYTASSPNRGFLGDIIELISEGI
jgi:hypothetical protein